MVKLQDFEANILDGVVVQSLLWGIARGWLGGSFIFEIVQYTPHPPTYTTHHLGSNYVRDIIFKVRNKNEWRNIILSIFYGLDFLKYIPLVISAFYMVLYAEL